MSQDWHQVDEWEGVDWQEVNKKKKRVVSRRPDDISIRYQAPDKIILRGDKNAYSRLIGKGGAAYKAMEKKYPRTKIQIPSKMENSDEIFIQGPAVKDVVLEVLALLIPKNIQ